MRKLTQPSSQNDDLYMIRCILQQLNCLVDAMEAERRQNALQNTRLCKHDSQLSELKKEQEQMWQILQTQQTQIQSQQTQLEECQESADYAVREVRHLSHVVGEKEALEERVAFYYPPD